MKRYQDPLTWRAPRSLNEAFGPYHDRSPVLLPRTRRPCWLVILDTVLWVLGVMLFLAVLAAAFVTKG